ncbi:hypothetical protein BDV37DRAFT_256999 [Aspergillus pseudonomiae]|uniref:Uncharacterized protein n=1 Tax=Aspergillus pseudonomiae TaxID=1506151 RepID=A0A5N7D3C7_9EURO|nr:uncharacterized protein BDV37DRAFT_256999 [Aspergillus pseudonomiae]KAE8400739.1 hypothetical protein BDV37DRAFT_256999 [Aspergillus pseudonomiae]
MIYTPSRLPQLRCSYGGHTPVYVSGSCRCQCSLFVGTTIAALEINQLRGLSIGSATRRYSGGALLKTVIQPSTEPGYAACLRSWSVSNAPG